MGELDRIRARQLEVATAYTEAFMDDVLGEAQRIVPLAEGTLAGSAGRETTVTPSGVTVRGYFATVYAARQHEEDTWKHRPGRQAHYLEEPFKAGIPRYAPGLARALAAVSR
jgi:hypothetical protein